MRTRVESIDETVARLSTAIDDAAARAQQTQAEFETVQSRVGELDAGEVGLDEHHDRFGDFFDRFGITIEDPLGAFAPAKGIPDAPATPEKLENTDQPNAEGGYADETYVDGPDGEVIVGGADDPDEVDVSDAPGVTPDDVEN